MSGNEILLNLDNHENLRNAELVGGLTALARKDRKKEFDWNQHPITARCIKDLSERVPRMTSKNVINSVIILDRLNILDQELWNKCSHHVLRLLHKYKGRDLATCLDLFDKDILDEEGEPHGIRKTHD